MSVRERVAKWARASASDVTRQIRRDLSEIAPTISGRLLDLGCGAKPYRHLFTGAEWYVGLDLPADHSANKLTKSVDAYADLNLLPFCDESFDAALCTQVLEHVPQPELLLAEAARVLKTDGTLVLTLPFAAAEHEEPHDYLRFTRYGIRALLERAGFATREVRKQFTFWSAIGEMIYWHFHRKVSGTRLEKYWFAFGTVALLRMFHLMDRLDRDDKLALNLCVVAQKLPVAVRREESREAVAELARL